MSKNKRIAPNVIRGGVAIPLKSNYFLMKGRTHREGGIDVGKDLEVEDGEVMKITKNNIKVLSAKPILNGTSPAEYATNGNIRKRFEQAFRAQERFKRINGLNDDGTKAVFGKLKKKISNFYWHTVKAPKDYSNEKASLRNGSVTEECAKWSNDQLQKAGLNVFGDAWTRSSNKNIKKIYSGYDKSKRPKEYEENDVLNYTLNAADSLAKTLDLSKLKENDIVGLYFRNSPNMKKAYLKGTNGETQTHTGHITIDKKGIPYVSHNVHGEIIKNKVSDLLGSNKPYGIVSVYRSTKKLGGIMKQNEQIIHSTGYRKKAKLGEIMKVDKNGQLIDNIEPAVVAARKPLNEIVQSELVRRILLDKIKLFDDEKIPTYKINTKLDNKDIVRKKAKLGTTETKKESISEILKRVIKESETSNKKLAAKITSSSKLPLNTKKIDSRALFKGSNSSSSNTKRSAQATVTATKKSLPSITSKAVTKDPGIAKPKSSTVTKASSTAKSSTTNKPTLIVKKDIKKPATLLTKSELDKLRSRNISSSKLPEVKKSPKIIATSTKATTNTNTGLAKPKRDIGKRIDEIDSSKLLDTKSSGLAIPKGYYKDEKGNIKRSINPLTPTTFNKEKKSSNTIIDNQDSDSDIILDTKSDVKGNNKKDKVSYLQANPTFLPNLISTGINIIGSGISYGINKKFLNELKAPKAPYLLQPTKLKTRINIKPQVNELKRTINRYNKYFDQNTASSQTAVGRRLLNEQTYIDNYNQLYGAKENQETQLINQDRLQQHETAKYNLTNYNNWLREKTNFENSVREKKSENAQMLTQNIAGSFTNFLDKQAEWKTSMANIAALSAAYPDVTPEYMAEQGLPYALWLKEKRERRNNS